MMSFFYFAFSGNSRFLVACIQKILGKAEGISSMKFLAFIIFFVEL